MKKHFIHTIISAMVIWGVYGPAVALSSEDNQSFLDMINEIREAPYDYAIKHLQGCTPEFLNDRGIESGIRFKSYTLDDGLSDMAEIESQSMADEEVPKSEEESPVYRLTASTGGVVSFFNFMPRDTAFRIVINYLFRKELENNTFDHILSEDYAFAGIAISAGKVGSGNAWFVAIRLGSSERVSEIQMLNLVNQVRSNPLGNIWEYTDWDPRDAYEEKKQKILSLLASSNTYNPLFFDASLSKYARDHSFYLLNERYPEHLSGLNTSLERVAYHGYDGGFVKELEWMKSYSSLIEEDDRSVYSLFLSWIERELKTDSFPSLIFLKDFQDVGSDIRFTSDDNISDFDVAAFTFIVGENDPDTNNDENISSTDDDETSRIYGVLFWDKDRNNLYSPGEEETCIQQTVTAYDNEMQVSEIAVTDNAGHFSMKLPTNRQYNFIATIGDVQVSLNNNPITADQFVPLFYTLPDSSLEP